jgi:hypothetical protein
MGSLTMSCLAADLVFARQGSTDPGLSRRFDARDGDLSTPALRAAQVSPSSEHDIVWVGILCFLLLFQLEPQVAWQRLYWYVEEERP